MPRKHIGRRSRIGLAAVATALVALAISAGASSSNSKITQVHDLSLELVAQAINSPAGVTPATSIQYGYVSYLRGLPVFSADPQNETTALFTFYTDTVTTRVISDGPLRVITREGTMTIYRDSALNGSFSSPDSFRDGTPVLVAGLRQQGIVDTVTGAFTLRNISTVVSSSHFSAGSGDLRLGSPGDTFTAVFNGHLNTPPGPPTGYLAGYAFSTGEPR